MHLKPLIAGNWKMNTTFEQARQLVASMLPELSKVQGADVVFCPPFVSLAAVSELVKGTNVKTGAQNMYFKDGGAFTGEISPLMLKPLCDFVIIGHSERRLIFGETGEMINSKVKKALATGLKPVLCTGETLAQRQLGEAEKIITSQIKCAFQGIDSPLDTVIAYEPVWAIGTDVAATVEDIIPVFLAIRETLKSIYGTETARSMRLLYGGSVTPNNFADYINQPEINGALVGGASLKPDQFISIVRQAAATS